MEKGAKYIILTVIIGIFVMILLTFCIRRMFGPQPPHHLDLTQQAHEEILKTFQSTTNNFTIWPERYDLPAYECLYGSTGIKNNDPQGRDLYFVYNVRCINTNAGDCNETNQWKIGKFENSIFIRHGDFAFRDISFYVAKDTQSGEYLFEVVACYGNDDTIKSSDCPSNLKVWGNKSMILKVTNDFWTKLIQNRF